MKKKHILVIAIVITFSLSACIQPMHKPLEVDDLTLIYQGVKLSMGQKLSTVTILDKALKKQKDYIDESHATSWVYDGLKFSSYGWNKDGSLNDMEINYIVNDKAIDLETMRGIKIGDKIDKVLTLYGAADRYEDGESILLDY